MKCSAVRLNLDLYEELSDAERQRIDTHVAACSDCRARFEQVQQTRQLVRTAASVQIAPEAPVYLTARIMRSIEHKEARRSNTGWMLMVDTIRVSTLRYACGVVATLLVIGFVYEQARQEQLPVIPVATARAGEGPLLNSARFVGNLKKHRAAIAPAGFIWCMKVCQAADGSVVCSDCKKQYAKLYSKI